MKQQHSRPTALVVDDEPDIRELIEITLSAMDIDSCPAATLGEARRLLAAQRPDFCLTDMRLPDGSAMELVAAIGKMDKPIPVAVITAYGSVETAVEAMKFGAFDFITKPVELDVLRGLVKTALKLTGMRDDVVAPLRCSRGPLLGDTRVMRELREKIGKLALSQAPVHISGESGTGKELVARLIHEHGIRCSAAFVPVNCGAIPPELVEGELFGHRKGAFTGAIADSEGLFRAANGGTLFLDEISELPLPSQVKLLRVLQERSVRPVGGGEEMAVDVRVLSASHRDLSELVRLGSFREDLFYRVNVIELRVPPLRERRADIPLLADYFAAKLAKRDGVNPPPFSAAAIEMLRNHHFPGNVRELENILERVLTWMDGGEIRAEDLELPDVQQESAHQKPGRVEVSPESAATQWRQQSPSQRGGKKGLQGELEAQERELIAGALDETRWNRTAAAKKLGITLRALRYRIKKLGLD